MKYLAPILALALAATANAGTESSTKEVVFGEPEFQELARISVFGTYRHALNGTTNADDFGAGISLLTPIPKTPVGIEVGYDWREGNLTDVHAATLAMRVNLFGFGNLTLYAIGGGSYQFTGSEDGWGYDAGGGVDYAITERVRAFADYRYRWQSNSAVGETGGARLGIGYSF